MEKVEIFLAKHKIDLDTIKVLLSQNGFRLLSDDEVFETQEWISNYQLDIELFPIITNGESDFIAVYTEEPLLDKIALLQHTNLDFTPKFKDFNSLINNIGKGLITSNSDWESFDYNFDYPSKEINNTEGSVIENLKKELINKNISSDRYELLISTIMVLTPYKEIESIYHYLDDKDLFVRQKCISILGDFYQHEPIKEKVRETLKTINNKILEKKVYNGRLIETKRGFWKSLFK